MGKKKKTKTSKESMPWVEKYRPRKLEHVIGQKDIVDNIQAHLDDKSTMIYMLTGEPGVGKTTIALAMAYVLTDNCTDNLKFVNASMWGRQGFLKDVIIPFCKSSTLGSGKKVLVLDEFDHASIVMQASFRRVLEEYSTIVNFILICNYKRKVLSAILSRSTIYDFKKVASPDLVERGKFILEKEKIEYVLEDLEKIAEDADGRPRDFINLLQQNSVHGKLVVPKKVEYKSQIGKMLRCVFKKEFRNLDEAFRIYYEIVGTFTSETREMLLQINDLVIKNDKVDAELKGKILRTVAETDYRLSIDTDPNIQMIGMIVTFYLIATPYLSRQSQVVTTIAAEEISPQEDAK